MARDRSKDPRRKAVERAKATRRSALTREKRDRDSEVAAKKLAPFDPEKFVKMERLRSRASLHTIAYAFAVSTAGIVIGRALGSAMWGAFAAILAIGSLYFYLKRVWDIDMAHLGKPTATAGLWFSYFITWIMVSFLLSNPPFFDDAPPEIHCCTFEVPASNSTGIWEPVNGSNVFLANGTARIIAQVFDNDRVLDVKLSYLRPDGQPVNDLQMADAGNGRYTYDLALARDGSYTLTVRARDPAGHGAEDGESLTVLIR